MKQIFGKDKTLKYFSLAINNNALNHLYIISAPQGQGKKTVAHHIATMLHCEGANPPCGVCSSCIKHSSGNHPDLCVVAADSPTASIGVDTVRQLTTDIYIKPLIASKKIYIIADGQNLTAEAQNSLLKILEEPPSYAVIFLLTTSREALLQTVLSRGILLTLSGNTLEEVLSFISSSFPEIREDEKRLIASVSCGNIGLAKQMCESGSFSEMRSLLYPVFSAFCGSDKSVIFDALALFEKYKNETNTLLELLNIWLRDVLYLKTAQDECGILNTDFKENIISFSSKTRAEGIIKVAGRISDVASTIGKGSNLSLWITDMLIKCWEDLHG